MVQIIMKMPGPGCSCPEWTIVELQGQLETKSHTTSLSNKFIGDLHFTHKNQPVLIIGHSILYGKHVELDKPLAVLAKSYQDNRAGDAEEPMETELDDSRRAGENGSSVEHLVTAVIKHKLIFKTRPKPIIANVAKKA